MSHRSFSSHAQCGTSTAFSQPHAIYWTTAVPAVFHELHQLVQLMDWASLTDRSTKLSLDVCEAEEKANEEKRIASSETVLFARCLIVKRTSGAGTL